MSSRSKFVIGAVCWVLITALVIYANRRLLFGDRPAPSLPASPPVEANRIAHPQGFSIIVPEGWKSAVDIDGLRDSIDAHNGAKSRRSGAGLLVEMLDQPDHLGTFTKSTFQGQPAFRTLNLSAGSGDYLLLELIFQRHDTWFRIVYFIQNGSSARPIYRDVPGPMVPFLSTFQ
jgi:hypothetical protein